MSDNIEINNNDTTNDTNNDSNNDSNNKDMYLQLGDIIQINAPSNNDLHERIFYIEYINNKKIKIINDETLDTYILNINDTGNLSDESIQSISLLSRAETNSYAKQNNLLPDTWIDIHFGGDIPLIITGKITNLEEDMIEVEIFNEKTDNQEDQTETQKEIIYIDFAYKGIPEDIPINEIIIRSKPEAEFVIEKDEPVPLEVSSEKLSDETIDAEQEADFEYTTSEKDDTVLVPTQQIKSQLKDIILEADQIEFGDELESITQEIEVPEEQKRYSIEVQTSELLDDLLASVPNEKRTRNVLNNIHIMIERFKQLREKFSTFDENGNANMPLIKGADYKPLVKKVSSLNYKLNWILPVAQQMKKLYDLDINKETNYLDIIPVTLAQSRINEYDIRESYKTNTDNYSNYMNKLNPYLTPYENNYNDNKLTTKEVMENFDAVIENLGEFYSSIAKNDTIKRKRYLISRYNLGLSKLQTTELTSVKMKSKLVPMTNNDKISVKSILTLEEPVVRFSKIHLPSTNIYDKTLLNRNFLNYWQLFKENTSVTTKYIDNLNTPLNFDENNYLSKKTEYLLSVDNVDENKFEKYLELIIPKTRVLFNLVKKYIEGKLSLVSVINYLQPFLIYIDDITFKQYEEITEFIENKILNYKKKYAENKEYFNKLSSFTQEFMYESMFYKLLKGRHDISDIVMENYGMNSIGKLYRGSIPVNSVLSSSEIIKYMNEIDYTKFFNTSISTLNMDLFTPFDFNELLNEKKEEYQKEMEKNEKANECSQYVLSKRYISLEDINADNDIPVYFDKKYDPTVYDIISEYKNEQSQMDASTFKNFLIDQLIKNIGLKRPEAKYEATSMIEKKREVQEGHYAVLEIDNIDDIKYYYYKRENDNWIRDESIPDNSFFGTNELFCNIQKKCIQIDKKCADPELGSDMVKKDLIKEMYDEFDENYIEDIEKYKAKMTKLFQHQLERVKKLRIINHFMKHKYENHNIKLVLTGDEEEKEIIVSPYATLLDKIMAQSDFIKRQHDIVKFVEKYTRSAVEINDENVYWLYCIETDTKILPTFVSKLASVFVEDGDYLQAMTTIKNEQGIDVDDKTIDKYSGYIIENIALNTDEGYEASGYKMQTREIMEMDLGTSLMKGSSDVKEVKKELLANPKGKIINNVVSTISNYMGLILENSREDIIQDVLLALEETLDTEDVYEEKRDRKLKEGKKVPPYKDVFNKSLLIFTLSYISLYVSVSIPSLQSKKTFPGCKKSLIGYPISGDEDLSNLTYIACVAAGIKTNIYPWKALPKSSDKIMASIKNTLDAYILKQGKIKSLIDEKRSYLLQNEDDLIPIELDIKRWINFLPPLQDITNKTPSNLSSEFRKEFLEILKKGSKQQQLQLNVIKSKQIYFSMHIIQSIQKIVAKEKMLLTNAAKVPFLQNACCNTGEYKTIDYFANRDKSIKTDNDIVNYLSNIIFDVRSLSDPTILVDPKDTKIIFPAISDEFSKETIYRAFIEFCNFNNDIPVNEKLLRICINKPDDYDKNASLKDNIINLEKEGKIFSIETFNELINAVSKMNIIPIDIVHSYPSCIVHIRDLLSHLSDNSNLFEKEFLTLYKNILDSYDIENTDDNIEVRDLRNYLSENIESMENSIFEYMDNYSSSTSREKSSIFDFIKTIMDFNVNGNNFMNNSTDETLYRSIQYIKNSIFKFIVVFPRIILNKVNYDEIKIPSHWKLSDFHKKDVKNILQDYYKNLKKFYKDTQINNYLLANERNLRDFIQLVNYTNLHSTIIELNGNEKNSILDGKTSYQLFRYFFLFMIQQLITLTNDRSYLRIEEPTIEVDDIITTSVEVEENNMAEITEIDIVKGEQRNNREKIADLITEFMLILKKEKSVINMNYQLVKEKINRAKDKERHKITSTLRDMTKEQREIENLFKNHRLERWNKGLQKGLTQYVAKTYDEERMEREKDLIMEQQLQNREMLGEAFTADREIAALEEQENQIVNERIEEDVYNMNDVPDDDDLEENNDDVYRLEFDDNEE